MGFEDLTVSISQIFAGNSHSYYMLGGYVYLLDQRNWLNSCDVAVLMDEFTICIV